MDFKLIFDKNMANSSILRDLTPIVQKQLKNDEVILIIGARQAGKTTVLRQLEDIIKTATKLFNTEHATLFGYRNFIEQLMYYSDVSYEEEVIYVGEHQPTNEKIKAFLTQTAVDFLKNKGLK